MKELTEFLIKSITGSDDFTVEEQDGDGRVTLMVDANPEIVGLIIGKEGKTIKNLRRIVSILATKEEKAVNISVNENQSSLD